MMKAYSGSVLAQPIKIGQRQAPNRVVYQPMEANDADSLGRPTKRTIERYRRFAVGSPGMIFLEAITVSSESRGRINQLSINRQTESALKDLVTAMREANPDPLIIFQITHDGRQSGSFSRVVAAFAVDEPGVEMLTTKELETIRDQFVAAAAIVKAVGADGIDFKHCHAYLCCEMLRPSNRRNDRYGGSFENRTRFFRETTEKIKKEINDPSFILGCRVSVYEPQIGGFGTAGPYSDQQDLTESIAFARMMEEMGLHYIDVTAGRPLSVPSRDKPEDVSLHFQLTERIKKSVAMRVIGSAYSLLREGNNKLPETDSSKKSFRYLAEKNIEEGKTDMVGIGRQSFADSMFAKKIIAGAADINYCTLCSNCMKLLQNQKESGCVVYDEYYRDLLKDVLKNNG
ncbi:MAG: 2,4-dienoyl-CoA reductase [Candidatus Tectomicrobia bacterium]|uniref:2,4-dienoyl-CoA reductase n=1 Tax=Tectimicrobiota bacterium TaxID=2528274 RepID=A0A933GNS2_UNCTE|nr:2,4-dienoyl-CoA reductase [Candidatus Tectomicrobia bacterium]